MQASLKKLTVKAVTLTFSAALLVSTGMAAGKTETFTGTVSDAMCGAKHEMAGSAADCTRGCIKHGSKYALVSGDKVYTLETTDQAALAALDQLAGEKAKVTGTVDGTDIAVSKVTAAK